MSPLLESLLWFALAFLTPVLLLSASVFEFLSNSIRRREETRFFLDLVESALALNQPVESVFVSIAASRDQELGVNFHLLAAQLENGLTLADAINKMPGFLQPQVAEILCVGSRLGDLKKVLPACREILREPPITTRTTTHYMFLTLTLFLPVAIYMLITMGVFIFPKLRYVAEGSGAGQMPLQQFLSGHIFDLVAIESGLLLVLFISSKSRKGVSSLVRWLRFINVPLTDWLAWKTPWKQKKLLRTFSAMLAVLLDGGVPEAEAVCLAGNCTANETCRRRASRVTAALERGIKLNAAVRAFDDDGEFRWRLANAIHAEGGFLNALRGWHEALDARAFQQQEAAGHATATGIVIFNGLLVALIALTVFGVMMSILTQELLSS